MPAVIFQKIAPRYSKSTMPIKDDHPPRPEGRTLGIGILISEYQVVNAPHQREFENVRVSAVAQDPVPEVLVVDRSEAAWIRLPGSRREYRESAR